MNETNAERSLQAACALKVHPYGALWGRTPTQDAVQLLMVDLQHLCLDLKLSFSDIIQESATTFTQQREFEKSLVESGFSVAETPHGRTLVRGRGKLYIDTVYAVDGGLPSSPSCPVVVNTLSNSGGVLIEHRKFGSLNDYICEIAREEVAVKEFEVLDDVGWIRRILSGEKTITSKNSSQVGDLS